MNNLRIPSQGEWKLLQVGNEVDEIVSKASFRTVDDAV